MSPSVYHPGTRCVLVHGYCDIAHSVGYEGEGFPVSVAVRYVTMFVY